LEIGLSGNTFYRASKYLPPDLLEFANTLLRILRVADDFLHFAFENIERVLD
jgi:hypothetical protein